MSYASATLEEQRRQSPRISNPYQNSRLIVEEDFSGSARTEIELRTSIFPGSCGYSFERGRRYLVYATPTDQPNLWTTSICSRTVSIDDVRAGHDLAYFRTLHKPGGHGTVWGLVGLGAPGTYDGPAEGIRVALERDGKVQETTTHQRGVFEFSDLLKGRYKVSLPALPGSSREVNLENGGCESVPLRLGASHSAP